MRFNFIPVLLVFNLVTQAQQYVISTVAGGAPPPVPVAANQASVGDPPRVAVDGAGNIYFGGSHCLFRVDSSGTLTRIAGNGRSGYSGDGGLATQAQLQFPDGIAIDASGNVYLSDTTANVVRMVSASGTITTYAGQGAAGYSGDGGAATQAQLNAPVGLALDATGNLYIADSGNSVVRKVSKSGVITTVAGNGSAGFSGDGGPATFAALNQAQGIAADAAGSLYIADTFNNRVRVMSAGGIIQTVAGTGISSFSGDGGPAASATMFLPTDVALDNGGNLYIADFGNSRIRKVAQSNIQTVIGGKGTETIFDEAVATSIRLNGPTGVAVDGSGDIFVAEGSIGTGTGLAVGDYKVWNINSAGVVSTAAGNGIESYSGDGGAATLAQLNNPAALTFDVAGNLYIADANNNRVRKITPSGVISTVAGTGVAGYSGDGGAGFKAQLNHPQGLTADADGNVYIADSANNRIRKLLPDGTLISIAGNGNASYYGDGGPANFASMHNPHGLYSAGGGHIYIADTGNQRIRELLPDGTITTVAGNGGQGSGGDGGAATSAQLNLPTGVALDTAGNIYIADQGNNRVRMVAPNGTMSTLAGSAAYGIGDGGSATAAQLDAPTSVAVDASGNVYLSDTGHNRVRQVSNGTITTLAGTGDCCYAGDGGPAGSAQLNAPSGLLVDSAGRIYVADAGNNAVRLVQQAAAGAGPTISAITNGASNQTGAIAPGEIVVIYGSGLGPAQLAAPPANGTANPVQFNGVVVLVDGTPAQIVYVSSGQVSAIVPQGVSGPLAQVTVGYLGQNGTTVSIPLAASSPAIFTSNSSGLGQALAIDADGSVNGSGHPAAPGSAVTLFVNGAPSQFVAGPLTVTIGGQQANIVNVQAGSTPGVTAVTVQVPFGPSTIVAAPVSVQVGAIASPGGVTLTVGGN
jgi:trimeric autotransporter adhesin